MSPQLSAVSLFSGCGGFCEGIKLAGYKVLCGVEKDRFAAETYRFNFGDTPLFEGDIHHFLATKPLEHIKKYGLHKVDLVFGGPPCQGYSQIGTRSLGDERNDLYRQFARVLSILQPPVFLMENVPNIVKLHKGHYKDLIIAGLRDVGYADTTFVEVTAADFGVPQERKRVFFIGVHDKYNFPYDLQQFIRTILAELKVQQAVTVWEAIGDLPPEVVPSGQIINYPVDYFSDYQGMMRLNRDHHSYSQDTKMQRGIRHFSTLDLHNHHTKDIQARRLALISLLEPGKKANSLPKSVWDGRRPEKWRRLHPHQSAYTLLANMHRDLSEFVHPSLNRWITVREAARLQSFHDGFVFVGSEWQQLKQIGNAVPPLLGRAMGVVATELLHTVLRSTKKGQRKPRLIQATLPLS